MPSSKGYKQAWQALCPRSVVANTVDLTELESPRSDMDSCASVCVPSCFVTVMKD